MGAIPPKAVINRFPQVGGNRTTEASEVVFDPTKGDEGVEQGTSKRPSSDLLYLVSSVKERNRKGGK